MFFEKKYIHIIQMLTILVQVIMESRKGFLKCLSIWKLSIHILRIFEFRWCSRRTYYVPRNQEDWNSNCRNLTDFHVLWNYFVVYGLGSLQDVLIFGSPWRYQLEDQGRPIDDRGNARTVVDEFSDNQACSPVAGL